VTERLKNGYAWMRQNPVTLALMIGVLAVIISLNAERRNDDQGRDITKVTKKVESACETGANSKECQKTKRRSDQARSKRDSCIAFEKVDRGGQLLEKTVCLELRREAEARPGPGSLQGDQDQGGGGERQTPAGVAPAPNATGPGRGSNPDSTPSPNGHGGGRGGAQPQPEPSSGEAQTPAATVPTSTPAAEAPAPPGRPVTVPPPNPPPVVPPPKPTLVPKALEVVGGTVDEVGGLVDQAGCEVTGLLVRPCR